jgi:hypothetical protein
MRNVSQGSYSVVTTSFFESAIRTRVRARPARDGTRQQMAFIVFAVFGFGLGPLDGPTGSSAFFATFALALRATLSHFK